MSVSAKTWLGNFAAAVGIAAPTDAEIDELLSLAGVAAHGSERTAAPVACWLAALAGKSPAEALAIAHDLVAALEQGEVSRARHISGDADADERPS